MKIFKIVARFCVLVLLSALVLGTATLGVVLDFDKYNTTGFILLGCYLFVLLYYSIVGFNDKDDLL